MPDLLPLKHYVGLRSQYQRSANIERDFGTEIATNYHLSESAAQALSVVADAIHSPRERAISLIGPYGSGKSAFCLYVSALVSQRSSPASGAASPHISRMMATLHARGPFVPVLMAGSREPIGHALMNGLLRAAQSYRFAQALDIGLSTSGARQGGSNGDSPRHIARVYETAASAVVSAGYGGLLVVVDELGKLLEHAALHPSDDVMVLQELAEAATRSGDAPLVVITVLHQTAEAYARRLGRTQQQEWAKVAERFRQVPFFPSELERMEMPGRAIERDQALKVGAGLKELSEHLLVCTRLPSDIRARLPEIADSAYPIHPLTLVSLPSLFSRSGQSHRSMFTFLAGDEPHSLGRFLRDTPVDPMSPPLYTLDRLFDYGAYILEGSWASGGFARRWAEAVETVEQHADLPEVAMRLLKAIAVLGLIQDNRVRASREVLKLALTGLDGIEPDVDQALRLLLARQLIVYRRYQNAYRLWEGGDLDIEGAVQDARRGLPFQTTHKVAADLCPPLSMIARRTSHETGALRLVRGHACHAPELPDVAARVRHDLAILFCVATDTSQATAASDAAAQMSDRTNLAIAVAMESELLREAALDVAACHSVADNLPALQTDRAARRELASRLNEAESVFRAEWSRLFGPGGTATWFHAGKPVAIPNSRAMSRLLSDMADLTYSMAPRLRNELINRHSLSSAAAAARRNLLEAMLTKATEPRLGIVKFPPEASIYECLLRATGIHAEVAPGQWGFRPPSKDDPARLMPAWRALEAMVYRDPPGPRPVTAIYALLSAPPYGVTEGVLPVMLLAFLLANSEDTTLYRDGAFLPEPSVADWEVLVRRPELFAVAGCRIRGMRAAVVARASERLGTPAGTVPVVRALFRMVKSLPDYAHKTRRLAPEVLAVRDAFAKARSPEAFLFDDLPLALRVEPLSDRGGDAQAIDRFFNALNRVLSAWASALDTAVAACRDALLLATDHPTGAEGWSALRSQIVASRGQITDPRVVPIVERSSCELSDQAALESVLAYIANRPPRTWTDADAENCRQMASVIGKRLRDELTALRPGSDLDRSAIADNPAELAARVRARYGVDEGLLLLRQALRILEDSE